MSAKKALKRLPLWLLVAVVLALTLYPLFYIFMTSLKEADELFLYPAYSLPKAPSFANYIALKGSMISTYFKNSLIVALITILGIIVMGPLAAYPLTKMHFKGHKLVSNFIMTGLMIPTVVSLLPMFQFYNAMGLRNTYWALIIPQVGFAIPISMYLCMGFMEQVPNAVIEAGYIDGAGSGTIFTRIILPLMRNTIATIAIFQFVFVWNEFTFATTFISKPEMKTLPLGLSDFANQYGARDWGITFAAVAVAVLPTLVVFFVLNKQVMEGMSAGAVKS